MGKINGRNWVTYEVSLVLLGKHSWKEGMGLKSGAEGSDVGRVRPTPFTDEDGTVAVIITFKVLRPRRTGLRAWLLTLVPFSKLEFADARTCADCEREASSTPAP